MEPTPTGGTPSRDPVPSHPTDDPADTDPDVRGVAELLAAGLPAAASDGAGARAAGRATPDDHAGPAPGPATPRSGLPLLPRRARTLAEPPAVREPEPRTSAGRDPAGRAYGAPDEETLSRLLTGLRDI